jgi:hypothetical protein
MRNFIPKLNPKMRGIAASQYKVDNTPCEEWCLLVCYAVWLL